MTERYTLHLGDCITVMQSLPENSVDSVVCDPPYHLTSIVKRFGAGNAAPAKVKETGAFARASRGFMGKTWDGGDIAFQPETWAEVWRVLKPGGYLLAFSGSRTYHRMACAIEDAGFEIRDQLDWIYGSGFPKSHAQDGDFEGWGTALKPAHEPICMARKPLAEGSVEKNLARWGTGGVNIDACRVPDRDRTEYGLAGATRTQGHVYGAPSSGADFDSSLGRHPANVLHDGSPEVLAAFPQDMGASAARFFYGPKASQQDRDEGLQDFALKHAAALPMRSAGGQRGGVALDGSRTDRQIFRANTHPTVKPTDLMRWCVRLVTRKGGVVLDPFMGSGSTGKAAMLEGMQFIGIDITPEYVDIARARIDWAAKGGVVFRSEKTDDGIQDALF